MGGLAEPRWRPLSIRRASSKAVGADIGLQQRELHQVELCPATADAFEFAGDRLERFYRSRKILPLERGESARHRRNEGPRWITTVARELFDLPFARLQRCLIAGYSLCERDVHVREGCAGARKRAVREIMHDAPCYCVTRMSGEFPAPQKRNRIGHLPARRPTMDIGREGFPEEPKRCCRIAGLEMAERQMPT